MKYTIETELKTPELQDMIKAEIARKEREREKFKNNQLIYDHLTSTINQLNHIVFTATK